MTDAGEVAADVGLEYVVHLLGHDLQAQRLQSVVRVAPRSKAVTAVEEIRFKHGLDNARYRSLQQPIRDRGDPQWARSGFAWPFGYFNPPDRWCAIGAGSKLCANLFDPLLQLAVKLLGALPVDAAGVRPREKFLAYAKSMLTWAYSNSHESGFVGPAPWWPQIEPPQPSSEEISKMQANAEKLRSRKTGFRVQ